MNMALYRHEMKMNAKSLCLWSLCVGLMCFGCMLLYSSLEESIQGIADSFSDLGAMSTALGMDKMSLATLTGYYATEITMMHGLGGAMFAAILGTGLLSKEESAHTTEFLNVLPTNRRKIILSKYLALVSNVLLLNIFCMALYCLGFVVMGEEMNRQEMLLYHAAACFMQLEIGTICFFLSACARRITIGLGLGITILLFACDMMCRIVPAIEGLSYVTPFYYANAADIFTEGEINGVMLAIGAGILIFAYVAAWLIYEKKDL